MNQAEHLYTVDRCARNPPADGAEQYAHARRARIEATYQHGKTQAQAALQGSTNWTRIGYSAGAPWVSRQIVDIVRKSGP
ncbi:hypothetical protein ABT104_13810 [Streptomyces mobaraensis]|uniref:hypothetical protein n=1 Tax=Streptomyces mobaraensis TaxID=35621 RepID=UPI00332428D0